MDSDTRSNLAKFGDEGLLGTNTARAVPFSLNELQGPSRCDSCHLKSEAAGVLPVVPLAQRQRRIQEAMN